MKNTEFPTGTLGTNLLTAALVDSAQRLIAATNAEPEDGYRQLLAAVDRLVPVDSSVVLHFTNDREPVVLWDQIHTREKTSFYDVYLGGAYLLSPLYQQWSALPSGFYQQELLEANDFVDSEFSRAYYQQSGLVDEANFLVQIDQHQAICVCFGRQQLTQKFSDDELWCLHQVEPMFRTAIECIGEHCHMDTSELSQRHSFLQDIVGNFGKHLLTEREYEVMQLMLKGGSSKRVARELDISPDTERGHRKRIYGKLGVTSQAELLSLLLKRLTDDSSV